MGLLKKSFFCLFVFVLLSCLLTAQTGSSKIIGKVLDVDGNPLAGVLVEADSPKLVGSVSTVTDELGVYRLLHVAPGSYTIRFTLDGFQKVTRKNVIVTLEQTLTVNTFMKLGKITESVTVVGQAPLIDVRSTEKGLTLTRDIFSSLPKGRNFDSLVSAIPGVHMEIDDEHSWIGGTSIDGASGAENMYYIDGVNINGLYSGQAEQSLSFDFVEEVQVKTSGYQAEFGGSLGGVISVVTRSGGNEFTGELLAYYSGSALTGMERDVLRLNPLDYGVEYVNYQDMYGKDQWSRIETGMALGGYLIKDKLWFFGSLLPVFNSNVRTVDWLFGDVDSSRHQQNRTQWNYSLKLTSQLAKNLRASVGLTNNFSKVRGSLPSRSGTGNSTSRYWAKGHESPNYTVSASLDYTLGNNLLVSVRGGYFYTNRENFLDGPQGPRYSFALDRAFFRTTNYGLLDIPEEYWRARGYSNYSYFDGFETIKDIQTRASFNLDCNYFLNWGGEHAIKAGVQWVRIEQDIDDTYKYPYVLLGWDMPFYPEGGEPVRGKYGHYAVRSGESSPYGTFANPVSTRWTLYLQDSWTINDKLTINAGIRMEKEDIPSFSDLPEFSEAPISFDFFDKFAPRLGFIYDVNGDSSLKLFGSYGLFYDVMKLEMAAYFYGGFKWISDYYTLDTYEWDKIGVDGYFPGEHICSVNHHKPSFDTTDPNLKPMSQQEISFGLEKRLTDDISLSVRLVNKHLIRGIEDVNIFRPGQGEVYYVVNPGYGWALNERDGGKFDDKYPTMPKAQRDYWGLNIAIDKRFSHNWLGGVSYTWSRLTGNYSGLVSSDEFGRVSPNSSRFFDTWFSSYTQDLNENTGLLGADRTHSFKVYGSYAFPFGLTVGSVVHAYSGTPVTMDLMVNYFQGFCPLGRGTMGRTPFMALANLYAEYNLEFGGKYRLQFSVNVDNLFNNSTAERIWSTLNLGVIMVDEDEMLAGFDYRTKSFDEDPRYGMEMWFHKPLEARLGIKFFF
jgi:hypothetical protein